MQVCVCGEKCEYINMSYTYICVCVLRHLVLKAPSLKIFRHIYNVLYVMVDISQLLQCYVSFSCS